jgi:hypothetical protein
VPEDEKHLIYCCDCEIKEVANVWSYRSDLRDEKFIPNYDGNAQLKI